MKRLVFAAVLATLTTLAGPVGTAAAADAPVTVTVQVIQASNQGSAVDPALAKIRSQLSSLKFSSYRLLETRPVTTALGAKHTLALPGGRTLDLYPYGISGGSLELLVTIMDGSKRMLDTTVRLPRNGTIVVGGPAHGDGVLIVALSGTF
ncbi:MAG TPA: hypothetical protein VFN94_02775 [Nitrospiria bacterium]|nr:hypothetical protein [Nitrospiria bacterium]